MHLPPQPALGMSVSVEVRRQAIADAQAKVADHSSKAQQAHQAMEQAEAPLASAEPPNLREDEVTDRLGGFGLAGWDQGGKRPAMVLKSSRSKKRPYNKRQKA